MSKDKTTSSEVSLNVKRFCCARWSKGLNSRMKSLSVSIQMKASEQDIQTPLYCQARIPSLILPLGKESPFIFSKFNPLNADIFCGPFSVRIIEI